MKAQSKVILKYFFTSATYPLTSCLEKIRAKEFCLLAQRVAEIGER